MEIISGASLNPGDEIKAYEAKSQKDFTVLTIVEPVIDIDDPDNGYRSRAWTSAEPSVAVQPSDRHKNKLLSKYLPTDAN